MESVTMDVTENQEECRGIQDQASGEVQVSISSMEAEVSHCHLLAKRSVTNTKPKYINSANHDVPSHQSNLGI